MTRSAGQVLRGAGVLLLVVASAKAEPRYLVIDLDTLGGTISRANAIADDGTIVGYATTGPGVKHAALWDETGIVDLGAPPGFVVGEGLGVNASRQVAGRGEGSPQSYEGGVWMGSAWTPIGMLPGHTNSMATDINAAGRSAGRSFVLGAEHRAVLWDAGVLADLGTLGGYSIAHGINDADQVVGMSLADLPGGEQQIRAFIWEDEQMRALDPLPEDVACDAFDVNEAGDIVGSSWWYTTQFFSASTATLWRDGDRTPVDLGYVPALPWSCGPDPRWTKSIARAINDHEQIVGEAMCVASGGARAAFLWQDGVMYNLNDQAPDGHEWDLLGAQDINNAGQIVGFGINPDGDFHAFLLVPTCAADVMPNGVVDTEDFLQVLAAWGSCAEPCPPTCAADTNDDCAVDTDDFLAVLSNWGPCPAP